MANHSMKHSPETPLMHRSPVALSIIALCSVVVASCMAFGNPVLWYNDESGDTSSQGQPQGANSSTASSQTPVVSDTPSVENVVIGEYKAISQSDDENRAKNIKLAASAINGVVIEPGQTFSFNTTVGDTEANNDYEVAPIVFGNTIDYARGGGICQVSTALYIAALKADMGIEERHPHSLVTDYAPIGLDATLVYGVMDLKLINRSEYPITIESEAEGQTVVVRLIGHSLDPESWIDATSKIIELRGSEEGSQNPNTSDGVTGASYYTVESYRVYYRGGVITGSEKLGTDTYEVYENSIVTPTEGGFDPTK